MPDIFKTQQFVETDDSVQIPDIEFAAPPLLEEDEYLQDEQASMAAEEGEPGSNEEGNAVAVPSRAPVQRPVRALSREDVELLFPQELAELRRSAAAAAYSDAIQQKRGEIRDCISGVEYTLAALQQTHNEFVGQYTNELKYLAVDVAEKVMLQRIEENDLSLCAMVMQAVASVKHSKWLSVEVSEHLVHLVDYLRGELEKPEYHGRAEVEPVACPDDTCRVLTEDGAVVSTITIQTENLREAFANAERE